MPNFYQDPIGLGTDNFQNSTTQFHPLGTRGVTRDGRVFRYCKAGASDLVAGNVIQSSAILTTHLGLTAVAAPIGTTSLVATPGATAAAANYYAEGYLGVDTTPGNGWQYAIEGHAAITASTAFTLNLRKDDAVQIAFTSATRYGLIANPYRDVIQFPATTATGTLVGVAQQVITAASFGWIQTWGLGSALITGTPALGAEVMTPGTAAGAAQVVVAAGTLIVAQMIGHMAQVGVDGKNNFVFLRIAS